MAKRALCDAEGCTSQGELDTYGSIPREWFTISRGFTELKHACSPQHARAVLADLTPAEAAEATVTVPEPTTVVTSDIPF